ncbi:MAG: hypothetical protein AAGH64_02605 [Planctomycetota bacterium]
MDIFLAILGLFLLSLLGTSRYAYQFRRRRSVAALVGGGWLSVLIGMLVGPEVTGLVTRETILQTVPLLTLGLGWVGFITGFQIRLSILKELPRAQYRILAIDALATVAIVAPVTFWILGLWAPDASAFALWLPTAFATCAMIGWKLETRSLGIGADQHAVLRVRATGTLLAIVAIVLFGLAAKAVARDDTGAFRLVPDLGGIKLLHTLVLAIAIGAVGRTLVRSAGDRFGYKLAIFLGIVAFTAGSAVQIGASPLIASTLAGVVFTNIRPDGLNTFEHFILRAEHVIAVLFGVLVGILMDPALSLWGLALVGALIACRAIIKPLVLRAPSHPDGSEPDPRIARGVRVAGVRLSPIMLVVGVSLVLLEPSTFHKHLLAALVFVGVVCEFASLLTHVRDEPAKSPDELPEGAVA